MNGLERIAAWQGTLLASDESGYGSYAGPLVVCAASTPKGWSDPNVKDSKQLSPDARARIYEKYWLAEGFAFALVWVWPKQIDANGVYRSLIQAHAEALGMLAEKLGEDDQGPFLGVADGNLPVYRSALPFEVISIPQADEHLPTCSLASCVAKHEHDRSMKALDREFPGYGFASNNGYNSDEHIDGLRRLGPCPQHRRSFKSVKEFIREEAVSPQRAWEAFEDEDTGSG